jgi:hypothetical protein
LAKSVQRPAFSGGGPEGPVTSYARVTREAPVQAEPHPELQSLPTATDFIKMPEQVGGIFVNPCGTSALKFFLRVAAGQQSNAMGPCPTRGQHVPGRIADHDGVFDLGPETVDRRQEKVGIRLSILDLIARHYGD